MKRKNQGITNAELADLIGDPEAEEEAPINPGAGEFRALLDSLGGDLEEDEEPAEPGEVDEFTLLGKMPEELRSSFTAFVKKMRAEQATASEARPNVQAQPARAEVEQLLTAIAERMGQNGRGKTAETVEVPPEVQLPEQFDSLKPLFDHLVREQFGQKNALKSEFAKVVQRLDDMTRRLEEEKVKTTFKSIKAAYGDAQKVLSPIVGEILKESPELALSSDGIERAFRMADKERKYEMILQELRAMRKSGALPRASLTRQPARRPPIDASKVKTTRDAARVAIRQMREAGFEIEDV